MAMEWVDDKGCQRWMLAGVIVILLLLLAAGAGVGEVLRRFWTGEW